MKNVAMVATLCVYSQLLLLLWFSSLKPKTTSDERESFFNTVQDFMRHGLCSVFH